MWPMRTKRRRLVGLGLVLALVALTSQWSAQADPFYPYPGLPEASFEHGGWAITSQVGISETAKARQWVRAPALSAASWVGPEDTVLNPEPGVKYRYYQKADVAFVSPPGYEEGYGHLEPLVVRTVGFGMVPIEATVQVSQRRADGRPIPIHVVVQQDVVANDDWVFKDAHVTDSFELQVSKVVIDGVDIGLTGRCHTATPAPVDLRGSGFTIPKAVQNGSDAAIRAFLAAKEPGSYFHPVYGGQLQGSIEIPAFTGCTTASGDDLSAMFTASVSGTGNQVIFRTNVVCQIKKAGSNRDWPPAPGENTPARTGCAAPQPIDYPARP